MEKTITSLQHPLVKHLVKLRQQASARRESNTVLIEGKTLVQEICGASPAIALLYAEGVHVPRGVHAESIYHVTEEIIRKIAGTESPEGILAEVRMPTMQALNAVTHLIVLDEVRDPGNMGTLLRTALALGWNAAYILDNSCDPFNDKALRAAKGATFRLPIQRGNWEQLKKIAQDNHLEPYVADLGGGSARQHVY